MNFMRGRYGNDQLGIVLFIVSFALEIIGRFTGIRILYWIGIGLFIYMFARMFSRNIYKRQAENQKFMDLKNRVLNWNYFRKQKKQGTYTYNSKEQAKNGKSGVVYCYYYCPSCKQQVRIPSGKGRVKVTCPKCGAVFEMES